MRASRSALVALVLTVACAGTGGTAVVIALGRDGHGVRPARVVQPAPPPTSAGPTTLEVNGAPIPAVDTSTAGAAIAAAGVHVRAGHYLAVVSQRALGPDGNPARILVDGRPGTLSTPVHAGEQITVRPGADKVEPTETVTVRIPPILRSPLYVGGRLGLARLVRGAISHERVSQRLLRAPRAGHLVRPGAVALTFDDGPALHYTRAVLAELAHARVHATFCMIGQEAAAHARLVRRVVAAGHALCDHTWDHDLELRHRPAGQIKLDIERGRRAIVRASRGVRPAFFRAPGGNWSPRIERDARAMGMTPLKWSVDTRDWARPGVHAILRAVYAELRPGGVILMHDGGGNRSETLDALRILLHRLPKLGYHFVLPPSSSAGSTG
jgi:peptidoglycan/xylan/chitin deacetylase (PgdA/CDA1 family)